MRIVLVTAGSFGDVIPFINIGVSLKKRGHTVTLVTSEYFRDKVESSGLHFYGFSTVDAYKKTLEEVGVFRAGQSAKIFAQQVLLPAVEPVYNYVTQEYKKVTQSTKPDELLVLATGFCFGAKIASEKWNIPLITIKLAPVQYRIASDRPNHVLFNKYMPEFFVNSVWWLYDCLITDSIIKSSINKFRSNLGLKPVNRLLNKWWNSTFQSFGLFPEWFLAQDKHWPSNSELLGFALLPATSELLSAELLSFLSKYKKPIVFTPGTAISTAEHFFREATKVIEQLNKPAIFLTPYKNSLPNVLPDRCIHVNYVPLADLLPRVSLLVHPGGIGTIAEAIRAAVPQIVIPAVNDQFDNARRVDNLGLGCCINQKDFVADRVVSKINYLLHSETVHNLLSIRSRSLQSGNIDTIADRIEQCVVG